MNSNTAFVVFAAQWDFLHPAFPEPNALEAHGKLPASVVYPMGQALGYHAASGTWRAPGAGVGPRKRLLKYPCATDAAGNVSIGPTSNADDMMFETVPMYVNGPFFAKDITGIVDDASLAELGVTNGLPYDNAQAVVTLGGA